MTVDAINLAVRNLVRAVMGMPDGSVRPAEQMAPTGGQTAEIATVKIMAASDAAWAESPVVTDGDGDQTEEVTVMQYVTASVNFYRSPAKDAAGLATYSNAAFDRAVRLPNRLQLSESADLMRAAGLGFIGASPARNLAALADSIWESRGQVDLTFSVIAVESGAIGTFAALGSRTINVENPAGVVATKTLTT